jgi:rfaE bifunctional protein kinase chain/domain
MKTVTKTRIMVGEPNRTKQQVIRIDWDPQTPPLENMERKVIAALERIDPLVDAWLVSDYDYFLISEGVAEQLFQLTRQKPLVVDSRYRSRLFRGARCMTPNESEALELAGASSKEPVELEALGRRLLKELEADALVITRGNQGMLVFESSGLTAQVPAVGGEEVVDVNGAGDTVAATLTAALVSGASTVEAARIASCAASVVVMKTGAATCNSDELASRIALLPER